MKTSFAYRFRLLASRLPVYLAAAVVCFLLFTNEMAAQVTVGIPTAALSQYGLQDIAQISVNNTSGQTLTYCFVEISCTDDNGNKVFDIKTPFLSLPPGNNVVGYNTLIDAQTSGNGEKFTTFEQTGSLPNGRYTVCASVYHTSNSSMLGTSCSFIQSSGSSGLFLLSPGDEEVIETEYPILNWMAMDMKGKDMIVKYSIRICQLLSNQNYQEAMAENPPLVFEQNLSTNSFPYPGSAPSLDKDDQYVWQVEADIISSNGVSKVYSEIWMFQFGKKKPGVDKKKEDRHEFVYLAKELSGSVYVFDKNITFRYNNEGSDSLLNYNISEVGSSLPFVPDQMQPVVLKPRINYIKLPVSKNMTVSTSSGKKPVRNEYILEVKNSRQESWKMKFVISKPSKKQEVKQ